MGCESTGVLQSQVIGIVYDNATKLPVSGAVITSPCWPDHIARSEVDGTFEFPVITEGKYDFAISKDGYAEKIFTDIELPPMATKYLEAPLSQIQMVISGTVFIASATPELSGCVVQKVGVSLVSNGAVIQSATRDDGAFSFVVNKPGVYTVRAEKFFAGVGYFGTVDGIEIAQGASVVGVQIKLQKGV